MAYFVHFSLNLISKDVRKKTNIPRSPNPTYSISEVPNQQCLQQQLCWRLFAVPHAGPQRGQRGIFGHLGENLGVYSLIKMQKVSPTNRDSLPLLAASFCEMEMHHKARRCRL